MPGDIDLTLSVSSQQLDAGLRGAESKVKASAQRMQEETASRTRQMEQELARAGERLESEFLGARKTAQLLSLGIAGGMAAAQRFVSEYAKSSAYAAETVREAESSASRFASTMGRTLAPALRVVVDAMGSLVSITSKFDQPLVAVSGGEGLRAISPAGAMASPAAVLEALLTPSSYSPFFVGRSIASSQEQQMMLRADEDATRLFSARQSAGSASMQRAVNEAKASGNDVAASQAARRLALLSVQQEAATKFAGPSSLEIAALRQQFVQSKMREFDLNIAGAKKARATSRFGDIVSTFDSQRQASNRAADLENQVRADRLGVEAQEARLRGVTAEAEKVRAIAESEEKIRKIRLQTFELPAGADRRLEGSIRDTLQRQLDVIEQNDLNRRLADKVDRNGRDRSLSSALRLEEQMTKAQELRLRGRDREADQLEVQAQFEKRIKDVVDTDFSSPAEADRYRGRLRMLMGDQIRMLGMLPPDRTASIGSGGYSAGIGRVAFGNGLNPGAAGTSPEAELKRANQTLKDISNKLDRRGAVFN